MTPIAVVVFDVLHNIFKFAKKHKPVRQQTASNRLSFIKKAGMSHEN